MFLDENTKSHKHKRMRHKIQLRITDLSEIDKNHEGTLDVINYVINYVVNYIINCLQK